MNTDEKFAILDAVLTATKISEEEITIWFQSRPKSSTSPKVIKSILPIAYKRGNNFEILPDFILERKDEVWGFEILPNIILAKMWDENSVVLDITWNQAQSFAQRCWLQQKQGKLPSKKVLKQNWSKELKEKIQKMDKLFYANNLYPITIHEYTDAVWCSETRHKEESAYYFLLDLGKSKWQFKNCFSSHCRLAISF